MFIYNSKNAATHKFTQNLHFVANFKLEPNEFTRELAKCLVPIYCDECRYNENEIEYNQPPAYFDANSEELKLLSSPMPSQAMHIFAFTLRLISVIVAPIEKSGKNMLKSHQFLQKMERLIFQKDLSHKAKYLSPRARYILCLVSMMRAIDEDGLKGGFVSGIKAYGASKTNKDAKMSFMRWSHVLRDSG